MSITVADALQIGDLSRCKLLAGSNGLNRNISYIDTMEIPNIQPWLKKNVLVITTGYSIRDDVSALPRLIRDLEKAGSAGLAIKTRFLGDIPCETIQLADQLAVPLIEIPHEIPFIELTMPLMKAIVGEHSRNLEFSEQMNQKFLELELNNGGFESIAKALANLIGLSVVIVSRSFSVLAFSEETDLPIPPTLLASDIDGSLKLSERVCTYLVDALDSDILLTADIPEFAHLTMRRVVIRKQICGYICIIGQGQALDDMQLIVLHHAATSVALEISKLQKLDEHIRFMQNSLFIDLLAGNVKSATEAESRAKLLRWPALPARLALVDVDRFGTVIRNFSEEKIQNLKESLHQLICECLASYRYPYIVLIYGNSFVILLAETFPAQELSRAFSVIFGLIKNRYNISVTIGISDSRDSYAELPTSYEEACDAIAIARVASSNSPVQIISNIRFEQALLKCCSTEYFRKYVENTIGKLEQYDRHHETDLTKTLDILIENMGARQITAKKLYIHRNTLANRLNKIEKITGLDLSKNENLYRLGFALRIRYYV
ncbi:PucR family transcriptional regulator [Oscillospiraceae bacterium LTW-04]|nr:PucR family transcriptional regulator ligand-binding domain-containing protein [Oscillospiraceae bacterium MB24-C1]